MKATGTTPGQDLDCSGQVGHPCVRVLHPEAPPPQPPGTRCSEQPELGHCAWPGLNPGSIQEPLEFLPLAVPRRGPGARPGMAVGTSLETVPGWPYLLGRRGTFDVEWVVGLLLLPGFSALWEQESRPVNTWDTSFAPSPLWGPWRFPVGLGPQGDWGWQWEGAGVGTQLRPEPGRAPEASSRELWGREERSFSFRQNPTLTPRLGPAGTPRGQCGAEPAQWAGGRGATGLTRASSSSSASGGRCFTGRCSSSWKMALGVSSSDSLSDGGSLIQASRSRLQDTARSHSGSSPCT